MTPVCRALRPLLILRIAEGRPLRGWPARHRDRCLRCQALEARTRATLRTLPELGFRVFPPGPQPFDLPERDRRSSRWVGAVAAGVGVLAVLVMWRPRALAKVWSDLQRFPHLRILSGPYEPPRGVARTG